MLGCGTSEIGHACKTAPVQGVELCRAGIETDSGGVGNGKSGILAGDFGIVTFIITLSNLAAGGLAGWLGSRVAIAIFATLTIAVATLYLVLTRSVRLPLAASPPTA